MRTLILVSFLFVNKFLTAQEVVYITIVETVREMEIEVITPTDEVQTTFVEMTPNDDVKVTFHDKTVKYFKDKSMSLAILIKKELEKWVKTGYDIEACNTFLREEIVHTNFPERRTVYVLVKE